MCQQVITWPINKDACKDARKDMHVKILIHVKIFHVQIINYQ